MMRAAEPLSTSLRTMLDHEAVIPPVSPLVRARVIARAQAALIARDERLFVPVRHTAHTRWAAAAALVGVTALAAGAGAYALRARLAPPSVERMVASPAPRPVPAPRPKIRVAAPKAPLDEAEVNPAVRTARLSRADAIRAELRLLRRARGAIIREDFSAALAPITEHARRFQDGRLAEEREALRVKTLAGLGRTVEAERAAAEFKMRFPRSVLSPAVSKMPASRP